MEDQSNTKAKICISCFFVIWCGVAFGMGIFALRVMPISEAISHGVPAVLILSIIAVPFLMGFFGLYTGIHILRGKGTQATTRSPYSPETIEYTGDYTINPDFIEMKKTGKVLYQVPTHCPACGAAINNEEVEWIGPLQATCPYCNATINAEEHRY